MQLAKTIGLIITLFIGVNTSFAQSDKTKQPQQQSDWDDNDTEKPVRFDVVVDDPMDKFGPQMNGPKLPVASFLAPEFYFAQPKKIKDTTLKFLCYDSRDTLLTSIKDFDQVYYYSLFKEYDDPVHTYVDNGIKKPLPVSFIVKRYDRIAKDKWMCVEYPGNRYAELKGNRNVIVRTDTVDVFDPVTHAGTSGIYKYYKVAKN